MHITRRRLLAATVLLAGVSGAGAAGVVWRWWDQPHGAPYAVLSDEEAAILGAFAEGCFPTGGIPAIGGRDAGVARYLDRVLHGFAPAQQRLLRLALHALEALPLVTHGSVLTALPVAVASEVIGAWLVSGRHEIRGLAQSFCVFSGMAWFAHPDVRAIVGPQLGCGLHDRAGAVAE